MLETYLPKDGDVVHLRSDCRWPVIITTGRYRITQAGYKMWKATNLATGASLTTETWRWQEAFRQRVLTPIDPAELERDRAELELRAKAPMRARAGLAQRDVDGLELFDLVRSPKMEF